MKMLRLYYRYSLFTICCVVSSMVLKADELKSPENSIAEISKISQATQLVFNEAKVADLKSRFLPDGEIVDEEGNVYRGTDEIDELLSAFFERFPGAIMQCSTESIHLVGPIAIEDGFRTMKIKESDSSITLRYTTTWVKTDSTWKIASHREFPAEGFESPKDHLQSLGWLVGDWINEGADGSVNISFAWSDGGNYLIGNYEMPAKNGVERKSQQRIGWDPRIKSIRSWLFDADGGFSEGVWTPTEDEIIIKSSSVNPDGSIASVTLAIEQQDKDHFIFSGEDRIVAGVLEPDFEVVISRRIPSTKK